MKLFRKRKEDPTSPNPPIRTLGESSKNIKEGEVPEKGGLESKNGESKVIEAPVVTTGSNRNLAAEYVIPPRPVLEQKLKEFYLLHEPKKADDLEKIITAAERNGLQWLQDGLARKYNGATIDFSSAPYTAPTVSSGIQSKPVPPVPVRTNVPINNAPPPSPSQAPVPPPAANNPTMFIGSAGVPANLTTENMVYYPNAAAALRSKGLGKYVKTLEERGIIKYEDIASLQEDNRDPLWSTMPPFPDKKNFRLLIKEVREYVKQQDSSAIAFGQGEDQQGDAPVAVVGDVVASGGGDADDAFAEVEREQEEQRRQQQEEQERIQEEKRRRAEEQERIRRENEENDRRRREQEQQDVERRRMAALAANEEKKQQRAVPVAASVQQETAMEESATPQAVQPPPPPPTKASLKAAGMATVAVAGMTKRKLSAEANNPELEQAIETVSQLKKQMEEQTNAVETITARWEQLTKELDEVQAQAQVEEEKLHHINDQYTAAKANLDKLRKQASRPVAAAAAAPVPPPVTAKQQPPAPPVIFEPADEGPPPQKPHLVSEPMASIAEESVPILVTGASSNRLMESSDPNPFDKIHDADGLNGNMVIAQEASHAKLRSTQVKREKTVEACDNFELDMKAAAFGTCSCGHLKSEHKSKTNETPAFQTAASRSNSVTNRPQQVHAPSTSNLGVNNTSGEVQKNASFAARGNQYPALEPCDNFQVDVSASAFGTCICGHTKVNHKQPSSPPPAPMMRDVPKLKSSYANKNDVFEAADDGHETNNNNTSKRPSGDATSGSFSTLKKPAVDPTIAGSFRRSSDTPAVTTLSATTGTGTVAKPPPPPRRPSETTRPPLNKSGSSMSSSEDLLPPGPKTSGEDVTAAASLEKVPSTKQMQVEEKKLMNKPASNEENHRDRLVAFYAKYNPEKLSEIDTILEKFKGKEQTLFKKLKDKYPDAEV